MKAFFVSLFLAILACSSLHAQDTVKVIFDGASASVIVPDNVKGVTYTLKFRRIKSVKLTQETFAEDPKIVDKLRRQVTSGAAFMSGQEPKLQDVEIEFEGQARFYLEENPYNRSMNIGKEKNGKILVKMKAEINQLLVNWVVSFSTVARVIKPAPLRKRLKEFAEYLTETYG